MKKQFYLFVLLGVYATVVLAQDKAQIQNDFYTYVNGEWMDKTEIPAAYGSWGSFHEVYFENQDRIKGIFEGLSKSKMSYKKGSTKQLVADLYLSAMDTLTIENLGVKPLEDYFNSINEISTVQDFLDLTGEFYLQGVSAPMNVYTTVDAKNSTIYALRINQAGLSLGNRAYYLEDNNQYKEFRKRYLDLIEDMYKLTQLHPGKEKEAAEKVFEMETLLARIHRTPVQGRDSERSYNKKSLTELNQLTFNIDWERYFKKVGIKKKVDYVLVSQPEFLAMFDRMLNDFSIEDWKKYMQWKVIRNFTGLLNKEIRDRSFEFYGKTLQGTQEQLPRWQVAQAAVNGSLGQPLGKLYVEKYFPKKNKDKMIGLISNLKQALHQRIGQYSWMSNQTKEQARYKLKKMEVKVGYPDEWLDYSTVNIERNDYFGNVVRLTEHDILREINKVGEPIDPNDWGMTPPTVNAYYSSTRNEIVFPAGILNPPFFDYNADDATNYGSAGVVIGHEISHGFDDNGSLYDADGNLKSWWTKEDREKFEAKAKKIEEQYNEYKVLDSISINGKLTLGENIGDLGGLAIAYEAMKINQAKNGRKVINGLSDEQRFFIAYAKMWRIKFRDETLENQVKTDTHSPGFYRANGALSNFEPFFKAFNIPVGSKMRRKEIVEIW
ncbi:M13 family metallopeptidase [Pontimicrobium aquaticum]|uniref:M13 family metallopeptidase n=1 Tax=Pontimicrobium aquaticum TaxID=2565367 RepID=A0A4U0EYF9_9FLAO|nr:M13 family metallopeptidase [Pontimicrobium aquaticum]TJY37075.1 M13 family metallopeptidase [Pontimicrobium aquaticum]